MSSRDNTFINNEHRTFYIHDNIDKDSISKVVYSLINILKCDQEKENTQKDFIREPIHIYINSYGGYVNDMWSLVDVMIGSKSPIYTYSKSDADSCGFFILIAGEKKIITKNTKLMYHQISAGSIGSYQDIKEYNNYLDAENKELEDFVRDRTVITQDKIDEVREKKINWYIRSSEAIELGVATDIIKEW